MLSKSWNFLFSIVFSISSKHKIQIFRPGFLGNHFLTRGEHGSGAEPDIWLFSEPDPELYTFQKMESDPDINFLILALIFRKFGIFRNRIQSLLSGLESLFFLTPPICFFKLDNDHFL